MSEKPKGLEMTLPAQAENVAVVRHALAGLAEEIGMDESGLADLKTVVTEACMNVVVHAYDGAPGPLTVEAQPDAEGLNVVVRDEGRGVRPRADLDQPSLRLGLSLIAALSSSFAISGGLGRGTEISMRLPLRGGPSDGNGARPEAEPIAVESTEIVIDGAELLAPVLARLVGALAARRDLSIDRLSDALLVTDALAAAAPAGFVDGRVRLALDDRDDGVDLRLGPLADGSAEAIRDQLSVPEVGSLEALTDKLAVDEAADGSYLVVGFSSVPAD